ncbi:DEAD/DEAH box helicase family protein [Clostridium estertheticum]|uniref:DEAD/DEAH box helicase family protein n=1 Tax=Clostridium estertheticum TaxID=238834 RepID=UPI001C0DB92B|nr:DEAD/DEAH box helicase family protein [Clostridium estertheticum]MBU3216718.1 DEAD/DEAH box helicase family protein [Clostridium estertheticum]
MDYNELYNKYLKLFEENHILKIENADSRKRLELQIKCMDNKYKAIVEIKDDTSIQKDEGVLSATTAFGKTVIGSKLIAERKVNTLIIVHTQQLLEQWKEKLKQFLIINEVLSIYDTKKRGRKKNTIGINIILKSNIHQNLIIIDQKTVWYGNINFLSYKS